MEINYCPDKKWKFYQDLLKAFKAKHPKATEDEIDTMALETWAKTETESWNLWYGEGKRDPLENPIFENDEYTNDKGEKISIHDLANDTRFEDAEREQRIDEELNDEITRYDKLISEIKDAYTKKIAILGNNPATKEHKQSLKFFREQLDQVRGAKAIVLVVKNALDEINLSYGRFKYFKDSGGMDISKAATLRNYVSAFNVLDTIETLLRKYPDELKGINKEGLREAISKRNEIQSFWEEFFKPEAAKVLSKVSLVHSEEEMLQVLDNIPFEIPTWKEVAMFMGDSDDPLLFSTAVLIDEADQNARRTHFKEKHEIDKVDNALRSVKGNPNNVVKLNEDLIERDINGKPTGRIITEFRSGELHKLRDEIISRLKAIEDTDSPEFEQVKDELRKFDKENFVQKHTKEYIAHLESLSKEAREVRQVFIDARRAILYKYRRLQNLPSGKQKFSYDRTDMIPEDTERLAIIQKGENLLKSDYEEDGKLKDEKGLRIAKELREYAKKSKDFYEEIALNKDEFERQRSIAEAKGEEYYSDWLINNATIKYGKPFWDEYTRLREIIGNKEGSKVQEKINSLTAPYKDEDGIVNGALVPDAIREKVLELQEDLAIIREGGKGRKITKEQRNARKKLNRLVKFVKTPYYIDTKRTKKATLSKAEFSKWMDNNHFLDEYTGELKPISIWTTMIPTDPKFINTVAPNKDWVITDVKDEYWNKDYRKDSAGYPVPIDKWKSEQYKKLMRDGNPEVIKALKYYTELGEKIDELNGGGAFALRGRFPTLRKKDIARILEGGVENAVKIIKESALDRIQARKGEHYYGEFTDEMGNAVNYVPVHFTEKIDPEEMSYDLATVYSVAYLAALKHSEFVNILDLLEGILEVARTRKVGKTDSSGGTIVNKLKGLINKDVVKEGKDSRNYKQLEKFVNMFVYGKMNDYLGDINVLGLEMDKAKLLDFINSFTSFSILAGNFIAGGVNILQAEANTLQEAVASQFLGVKEWRNAKVKYSKDLVSIAADIGNRIPKTKINYLNALLNTFGEYNANMQTQGRSLVNSNTLFFTINAGEHAIQSQTMIALLEAIVPLDKDGKTIPGLPTMFEAFKKTNGKFELDDRVANFGDSEQKEFTRQLQFVIRYINGNYANNTKVGWQTHAGWRLIGSMRKWIVPTMYRRYGKKQYNRFANDEIEGFYRTTGRYLNNLRKSLLGIEMEVGAADWDNLSDTEKGNIKKTIVEVGEFVFFLAASSILYTLATQDKKKGKANTALLFLAYQAYRMRKELTFYINPVSAMQILRSPAASLNMIESIGKILYHLTPQSVGGGFGERYKRGDREGDLKIWKNLEDFSPFYKHGKRAFTEQGITDQISWIKMK